MPLTSNSSQFIEAILRQLTNCELRTAAVTGGSAGGGALIGGLAGGGKGALIGGLVGAGGGAAVSAFTGNKDLQILAESVVTFKLANSITVKRSSKRSQSDQGDQGSASTPSQ